MYSAVWELLVNQYNNENSVAITKTLSDGTSLTLKKTPLDYLICKIDENNTEQKINKFYDEVKFTCWVINTTTNEFKLPQNTRRELVENWKDENGNWYNLYSDGWLEQGGIFRSINSEITVNLNLEFSDNKYSLVCSGNNSSAEKHILDANIYNKETAYFKGFPVVSFNGGFTTSNGDFYTWLAKGYANTSALNNQFNFSNYLYFKVGNTTVGAETIDVGHLIVEVNNKANISGDNVNFNNLSETAKENIQNCLIPDLDNPITVSNGMTIEHNGILYFRTGTLGACAIFINGVAVYHVNVASGTTADGGSLLLFKGDVLTFNNLDSNSITKFYYFK